MLRKPLSKMRNSPIDRLTRWFGKYGSAIALRDDDRLGEMTYI